MALKVSPSINKQLEIMYADNSHINFLITEFQRKNRRCSLVLSKVGNGGLNELTSIFSQSSSLALFGILRVIFYDNERCPYVKFVYFKFRGSKIPIMVKGNIAPLQGKIDAVFKHKHLSYNLSEDSVIAFTMRDIATDFDRVTENIVSIQYFDFGPEQTYDWNGTAKSSNISNNNSFSNYNTVAVKHLEQQQRSKDLEIKKMEELVEEKEAIILQNKFSAQEYRKKQATIIKHMHEKKEKSDLEMEELVKSLLHSQHKSKQINEMKIIVESKNQLLNDYKKQMKDMNEQMQIKDALILQNKKTILFLEAKKNELQMELESKDMDIEDNFNVKLMKNGDKRLNMRESGFKSYFYSVVAKCADKYYEAFVKCDFNDLEIMIEFARVEDKSESLQILCNDCGMNKMHARQFMRRLAKLSTTNSTFENWFESHAMSKYYEMMLEAGVVTFAMFEKSFVCCTDFVEVLGEKNEEDGIFIWRNIPLKKNMRENKKKSIPTESANINIGENDEGFEG